MDGLQVPDISLAAAGLGRDGFAFAQAVLDAAPVIVLVLDRSGRIVHYNPFMERLCGLPLAQTRGRDWFAEFLLDDDREPLRASFAALGDQPVSTRINAIRIAGGETRLIEWHNRLLRDEAGTLSRIVSIGVDISERVRESAARLELVERFEQFTRDADEVFFMTDAERRRILYLSPAFERITKVPREALYADTLAILGILHPRDHASFLGSLGTAPTSGQVEREYRIVRASDSPGGEPEQRWLRLRYGAAQVQAGEAPRLIGVMTDITERKRASEQLEQLGRIFRCFEESVDQVFVLLAPQREQVVYVSRSIERLIGVSRDEVQANPLVMLEHVHADDRERIKGLADQPSLHARAHEFRVIRRDGAVRWVSSRSGLLGPDSAMPGALASVIVDVTEQHEAEQALRILTEQLESRVEERTRSLELERRRLAKILDGMAAFVAIVDPEGRVLHVNRSLRAHAADAEVGRGWAEVPAFNVAPSSRADIQSAIVRARAGEQTRMDVESINPQGRHVITDTMFSPLLDEQGHVCEMVVTSIDVTERRAIEQQLRASHDELACKEARLADAQRIAEVGDWDWEIADDRLRWSDELYLLFGLPRETPLRLEVFLDTVHPDDRASVQAAIDRAIAGHAYEIEHRVRWPSGEIRHVLGHGEVVRDATGQALRMRGTAQDVTRRKQVEAQLRASLAEKDALLHEVHHRVKNNLQVVASILYLEGIDASSETQQVLDDCSARIRSMALVHEQLYMSSAFASIDMREFLVKLAEALAHVFVKGRNLQVVIAGSGLCLDIQQAIPVALLANELLTNALKYAYPTLEPERSAEIRVRVHPDLLEIADDGVGLPPNLDIAQASTLGLRLVHMLARQLGVRLEFGPGPGTCVRLVWSRERLSGPEG